jgi:hypothetical protein
MLFQRVPHFVVLCTSIWLLCECSRFVLKHQRNKKAIMSLNKSTDTVPIVGARGAVASPWVSRLPSLVQRFFVFMYLDIILPEDTFITILRKLVLTASVSGRRSWRGIICFFLLSHRSFDRRRGCG